MDECGLPTLLPTPKHPQKDHWKNVEQRDVAQVCLTEIWNYKTEKKNICGSHSYIVLNVVVARS